MFAAVGLVVVTGLAVWSAPRGSEPVVRPLRRFAIDLGPALPIAVSNVRAMPTVSPDGTQLVYAANIIGTQKLYLRTFGQLDAQPITGIENAYEPFFSPDGEWVRFLDPIFRVLKRVSVRGGPALTLSDCYPLAGATWFPDGTIVFAHDEGGTALLFTIASDLARADASRVAVLSLDSGEYHTVVNGGYNARYVPIGHLVFGRQGALWGVPVRCRSTRRHGARRGRPPGGRAQRAIRQHGALGLRRWLAGVYGRRGNEASGRRATRSSGSTATEARSWSRSCCARIKNPSVSPDGSRLAVSAVDIETGVADIWVYDLTTGAGLRLTREGDNTLPR